MSKNIVICCDGTGNQVEGNLSNVLKLFRIATRNADQRVYYDPGVGTLGILDPWNALKQDWYLVLGLATGYGLDDDILSAYTFLAEHYEEGDSIFLFGFSRGAYTVRALAAFVHMVGLLPSDQVNIADYALTSYKRAGLEHKLDLAWTFGRITGGREIKIKFIGVWDTVASLIVPRPDRFYVPMLQTLPYTRTNPSVQIFRQAMAIDERRRMFRLNRWKEPQPYIADPFAPKGTPEVSQDIKQVWFAGVHSDVGGGYPESESGLSKFPLDWMIGEAKAQGLQIDDALRDHLVFGKPYLNSKQKYVAPNAEAKLHQSLTWAWKTIEWWPKRVKYEDWPRPHLLGWYIPCGEPRLIQNPLDPIKPRIHQSVLDRMNLVSDYKPINFPQHYDVEAWSP